MSTCKKLFAAVIVIMTVMLMKTTVLAVSGNGTEEFPYVVTTYEELKQCMEKGGYVEFGANISQSFDAENLNDMKIVIRNDTYLDFCGFQLDVKVVTDSGQEVVLFSVWHSDSVGVNFYVSDSGYEGGINLKCTSLGNTSKCLMINCSNRESIVVNGGNLVNESGMVINAFFMMDYHIGKIIVNDGYLYSKNDNCLLGLDITINGGILKSDEPCAVYWPRGIMGFSGNTGLKITGGEIYGLMAYPKEHDVPKIKNCIIHGMISCGRSDSLASLLREYTPTVTVDGTEISYEELANLRELSGENIVISTPGTDKFECKLNKDVTPMAGEAVTLPTVPDGAGYTITDAKWLNSSAEEISAFGTDGGIYYLMVDAEINDKENDQFDTDTLPSLTETLGSYTVTKAQYAGLTKLSATFKFVLHPIITQQPNNVTVHQVGDVATFSIAAYNADGYQWFLRDTNGNNVSWEAAQENNIASVSDVNGTTFQLTALSTKIDDYKVYCQISFNGKIVNSKSATVSWKKYKVTFEPGREGFGSMKDQYAYANTPYFLPECAFQSASTSIRFGGWRIGNQYYYKNEEVILTQDSTVTALWETITISGSVTYNSITLVGQELTTEVLLSPSDVPKESIRYQWQVSDDGINDWMDVSGANKSYYTPEPAEAGKYVRLVVRAIGYAGFVEGAPKKVAKQKNDVAPVSPELSISSPYSAVTVKNAKADQEYAVSYSFYSAPDWSTATHPDADGTFQVAARKDVTVYVHTRVRETDGKYAGTKTAYDKIYNGYVTYLVDLRLDKTSVTTKAGEVTKLTVSPLPEDFSGWNNDYTVNWYVNGSGVSLFANAECYIPVETSKPTYHKTVFVRADSPTDHVEVGVTKQVGYSDVRNAVCVFEVTDQAGNHALERLAFENVIMTAGETTAVYYEAIPSPTVVGTLSFEKRQGSPASALTLKAEGDGSVTISAPADAVPGDYYYDVKVDGKNTRVSSFVQVTVLKKKEPVVITVTADDYYFEGFENDGVPEGWTFVDADGDGNGWFGSDSSKSAVRTGDWVLTSESSSEEQGLLQPDNWAFTPALRLPEGAMLSFWIRGEEYMYCEENLAVYAGFRPNPDDVTKIAGDCKSVGQYVEYVVDLSDYAGQTVYLGFRHYESCDQSSLNLDDVRVGVNPSVDLNVKIAKKSLRLQDTIAIDFKVSKESLTGYHDPYLCVSQGNCVTRLTDYYDDGTLLVYTYRVAPQMIVDEVAVVPHVLNAAGEDVRGETFNYSVVTYCQNMLGKAEYQTEKWAPFRRLLVDILRYGDASQLYVTYRPFDLPSYRLTAEQLANGTDVGAEMHYDSVKEPNFAEVDEKDARATIATASLYLEAAVNVRYKIEASDVTNLRLVVTDGTNVLEDLQLDPNKKDENGRFYADLDCLNAGEMKKTVYATVMDGNKKVSNTYRYSIESYAASMKGKHGALLDNLIDAMMRYGNSAADYVESMK